MGDNNLELDVQLRLELDNDFDDAVFKKIEAAAQKSANKIDSIFKSSDFATGMLKTSIRDLTNLFKTLNIEAEKYLNNIKLAGKELDKQIKLLKEVNKLTGKTKEAETKNTASTASKNTEKNLKEVENTAAEASKNINKTMEGAFDFKNLKSSLNQLSSGFKGITGLIGKMLSKLGPVGVAIASIGAAAIAAYKIFKKFVNILVDVGKKIKAIEEPIIKTFAKIESTILVTITKFNLLTATLKGLKSVAIDVGNALQKLIPDIDLSGFLKESVDLASSLSEVQNVINVVFKDGAERINKFTETAISKLGMTTLSAKQFAGKFGAALQTTGQSTKSVEEMSVALTKLTSDLSSFYDIEQDVAAEKLFSGVISGQIKPMRELGLDMSKASLEAYSLAKGYSTVYSKMSAAEKQALRFNYAMEKLAFTSGDYERTINSTANQIRLLKNQFKELASVLGAIINSVFNPFIIALNQIMSGVIGVVKSIASALGIDWSMGAGSAASTISGLSDAYDDLADSEDDVAESTEKAAKEAKKALAPFHKLNVLQNKDNADAKDSKKKSGTGASDIGLDTQGLQKTGADLSDFRKQFDKFLTWLHGLDTSKLFDDIIKAINNFAENAPTALKNAKKKIEPYVTKIALLFDKLVEGIDWESWGKTVSAALDLVGSSLNTFLSNIHFGSVGEAIGNFINGFTYDLTPIRTWGENLGLAIQGVFDTTLAAVKTIKWDRIGLAVYNFIKGAFDKLSPARWYLALKDGLSGVTTALNTLLSTILRDAKLISDIGDAIVALPLAIANWLGSSGFSDLIHNCGELVRILFSAIQQSFADVNPETGTSGYQDIGTGLTNLIKEAVDTITSKDFQRIVQSLLNTFIDAINEGFKGHPIAKEGFLHLMGTNLVEWEALSVATDAWGESLNKVDANAKKAASSVELYAKYNKDAYQAQIDAGASASEIEKAADKWYKAQGAAERYQMTLDTVVEESDDLQYLVINSDKANESLKKQGKSADDLAKALYQVGASITDYDITASGSYEKVLLLTKEQVTELKNLGIEMDNASSGVKLLTDKEVAGYKECGIALSDYANGAKTSYGDVIIPNILNAREASNNLKEDQIKATAIAEKYGYSYEEAYAKVARSSNSTLTSVREDSKEAEKIYSDLAKQKDTTTSDITKCDDQIEQSLKDTTKTTGEETTTMSGLFGQLRDDVGKAIGDAVGRANDYTKEIWGTDTKSTVESNAKDNVVDPAVNTIETGFAQSDLKNVVYNQIADENLKTNLDAFLKENVGASVEDVRDYLAENYNILMDADGNLIGATPDTIKTATTTSLSGVNDGITEKQTELSSGEFNLLTPDGTLLGESQDTVHETANTVLTGVDTAVDEHKTTIDGKVSEGIAALEQAFTTFAGWVKTDTLDIILGHVDTFIADNQGKVDLGITNVESSLSTFQGWFKTDVLDKMYSDAEDTINKIKDLIDELIKKLDPELKDAIKNVKEEWDNLTKAVKDFGDGMKTALDAAALSAENLASKLREAASAQNEYNSAAAASTSSSSSSSSVPGYASGGVFYPNRPQLAILGDNKSQMEYALTTGHLKQIADMMSNVIGSSGFEGNITIPIYVDGVLSAKKVITASQMHNYRSNGR